MISRGWKMAAVATLVVVLVLFLTPYVWIVLTSIKTRLDALADVVFFVKDLEARYLAVNQTLVRRNGPPTCVRPLCRVTCRPTRLSDCGCWWRG